MTAKHRCYIIFTEHQQAELIEREEATTPLGREEVEGRSLFSLISTGTELACYAIRDNYPFSPGYATAMEVESVGADVEGIRPGDIVFCATPHASHHRIAACKAILIPQGLSPKEALFARIMGVSMTTLTTTVARPPARVIVTGLGPIGHLAAQMFAASGYDLLAIDPSPERRAIAQNAGIAQVRAAIPSEEKNAALIVECSGHEQAVFDACKAVRKGGEVALVGVPWQRKTDHYMHELLNVVFHGYVTLRSGWEWELPGEPTDFAQSSILENWRGALRWLHEGRIRVDGLYRAVSPSDPQKVYQELLNNESSHLVTLFDWTMLD